MLGTLERSTILRLRVKGSDLDPLALRGRLENLFSDVSLNPRLPPSAILFIRKLDDPLPGSLQLDTTHPRAPHAWRHAFQTRFDQLVSSAARPARGFVADSAESVVFYDYAELLACLTADWCSGVAMTRWWWQAFIKRGDVSRLIRQFWREKIEYVPAALEYVVQKAVVVEFVSQLSEVEVREIVQRVVQVFGVTRITRIKATDFFPVTTAPTVLAEVQRRIPPMPWKEVVPESDTPLLTRSQQFFLGIVLMVHRAPTRVRTLSFAREVERWLEPEPIVVEEPAHHFDPVQIPEELIDDPAVASKPSEPLAPIRVNPDPTTEPPQKKSVSSAVESVKIANATFQYHEPETVLPVTEQTQAVSEPPPPLIQSEASETFLTPTRTLEAVTIETELGGLFYLINLAIFLEIYSDFTSPVEQFHDDLSIWEFVRIVGDDINAHRDLDDPIWTGLQNLQDEQDINHEPTWLFEMLPDLRARLNLALGIDDADLADILLHHYAKVTITPTHLDVFFSLADHPIEIRLSGLDRDPGWVPAAGKFISFHYD